MEEYYLAICIPTFNMGDRLGTLLASIERELATAREPVQVVIVDNASTDETVATVEQFKSRLATIKYHRHASNLGADRNFLAAVEFADARYCWLMGADDALAHSSLERVLSALHSRTPAVLLGGRIKCDIELEEGPLELPLRDGGKSDLDFRSPEDVSDYFARSWSILSLFSYLSSIVVEQSAWKRQVHHEELIGTAYVHVGKVLDILFSDDQGSRRLSILPEPIVMARHGNDTFSINGPVVRFFIDLTGYRLLGQHVPIRWRKDFYLVVKTYIRPRRMLKMALLMNNADWRRLLTEAQAVGWTALSLCCLKLSRLLLAPPRWAMRWVVHSGR